MKKTRWGLLIILIIIFFGGFLGIIFGYRWFLNKMRRVDAGTARATFPYSDYSDEELNKLYPQYIENKAPTIQSPEQTHELFVTALKKGDFDEAVKCCFREGDQAKMKESLEEIKTKGLLTEMIEDLNRNFVKESMDYNLAIYSFSTLKNNEQYGHRINFIKNSQGVWLIESL